MNEVKVEWLQSIDELKEVPAEQLEWFIKNSIPSTLAEGEYLLKPEQPILFTDIILSGQVRLYKLQKSDMVELRILEAGDISGYLPFSRGKVSIIYAQTLSETGILQFPIEKMDEMIHTKFELTQALVHVMTSRVREATSLLQQNDKMLALGKLSAGLAHELNNPAAALVRGSATLKDHLRLSPDAVENLIRLKIEVEDFHSTCAAFFTLLERPAGAPLTIMQRADKEDEVMDWLDEKQVDHNQELAENLVDFNFGIPELESVTAFIKPGQYASLFHWINTMLTTERMVSDIQEASTRIGALVQSVKTFTHMDQGHEKQLTDIHTGIRNTLAMLDFKIKKGNIQVVKNYDPQLPQLKVMIGEMNQVWTNLIDNALDAMEDKKSGILEIVTSHSKEFAEIRITDNGPGIAEDIRSCIFDPFFTTKEVGKGTGMGLDVVARIVRQHQGTIKVESVPGHTVFRVCLPLPE